MLPGTRRHLIKSLVLGVLLTLSLHYLADFSWKQTAALILLVGLFYSLLNNVWRAILEERNPTRFVVFIRPKWREILFDHGLVRDEQEWQQWGERIKTASVSEQSLLRDGFHFTALQQARDFRSQFVFRNDRDGGRLSKRMDGKGQIKKTKSDRSVQPASSISTSSLCTGVFS